MFEVEGLTAVDLLATMVLHRVQSLQCRPHLICQMGGRHDPCRLSTKELRAHHVARRVNLISDNQMDEDEWSWGKAPYERDHPAPMREVGARASKVERSDASAAEATKGVEQGPDSAPEEPKVAPQGPDVVLQGPEFAPQGPDAMTEVPKVTPNVAPEVEVPPPRTKA
ncbi:hypothetical protein D1007_41817 [Hordeum vulgare]|nr:hypothetical protein D1007_41817 [Hordeum vulgare]